MLNVRLCEPREAAEPSTPRMGAPIVFALIVGTVSTMPIGCSGGSEGPTAPVDKPDPPSTRVESVTITPVPVIRVGDTIPLTATAKNGAGQPVQASFGWSSNATLVLAISGAGAAVARTVGQVTVVAKETVTGVAGTLRVSVLPPSRPAGAILALGQDSVSQFGQTVYLSTLGIIDTAKVGGAKRLGIPHATMPSEELNPPVLRSLFPQFSAVTECSDGRVYGASWRTQDAGVHLWQIDPATSVVTMAARDLEIGPGTVRDLACEGPSVLLVASWAGLSDLFRVSLPGGGLTWIVSSPHHVVRGIATSPNQMVYVTTYNYFDEGPEPQLLEVLDTKSGKFTPVGVNQPKRLPRVYPLHFVGSRLFGFGLGLVELDPSTGEMTSIHSSTSIP